MMKEELNKILVVPSRNSGEAIRTFDKEDAVELVFFGRRGNSE